MWGFCCCSIYPFSLFSFKSENNMTLVNSHRHNQEGPSHSNFRKREGIGHILTFSVYLHQRHIHWALRLRDNSSFPGQLQRQLLLPAFQMLLCVLVPKSLSCKSSPGSGTTQRMPAYSNHSCQRQRTWFCSQKAYLHQLVAQFGEHKRAVLKLQII